MVAATVPFACFVVAAGSRRSVCVARCSCIAEKMLRREGCGNGADAGARGMDENEGGSWWWCSLEVLQMQWFFFSDLVHAGAGMKRDRDWWCCHG